MKKVFSALVLVSTLAGCVSQPVQERVIVTKKRDLTDPEKQIIENSVKDRLKDPDSAMFKLPKVNEDGKPDTYCGLVNAKNSYGGYTGYKPFLATLSRPNGEVTASFPMMPDASRYGLRVMIDMCHNYGYDF